MRNKNTGMFGTHRGCTEVRTWNLQCVALLRVVSKHRGWSAAISSQKAMLDGSLRTILNADDPH